MNQENKQVSEHLRVRIYSKICRDKKNRKKSLAVDIGDFFKKSWTRNFNHFPKSGSGPAG